MAGTAFEMDRVRDRGAACWQRGWLLHQRRRLRWQHPPLVGRSHPAERAVDRRVRHSDRRFHRVRLHLRHHASRATQALAARASRRCGHVALMSCSRLQRRRSQGRLVLRSQFACVILTFVMSRLSARAALRWSAPRAPRSHALAGHRAHRRSTGGGLVNSASAAPSAGSAGRRVAPVGCGIKPAGRLERRRGSVMASTRWLPHPSRSRLPPLQVSRLEHADRR